MPGEKLADVRHPQEQTLHADMRSLSDHKERCQASLGMTILSYL